MKKFFVIAGLGFAFLCMPFTTRAGQNELTVFKDGTPKIYLNINIATGIEGDGILKQQAIPDFIRCFKTMTGCVLPEQAGSGLVPLRAEIVDNLNLKNPLQSSIIDVSDAGIVIKSGNALGIANALYTMLDGWGCRWVMPGEMGEIIPHQNKLSLPPGKMPVTIAMDSRVESSWKQGDEHPVWRARNRMGSTRWQSAQHYWLYAFPPETYFKEHPEYYALIGGKRIPSQLCVSNPEVRELMAQKGVAYFKTHPTCDSFPMDPADGFDHCQCENCMKLDKNLPPDGSGYPNVANRVADFANFVAVRLAKELPGKKVGYYAYANKKLPPAMKLQDNIYIGYTRDSTCLIHLTPNDKCPSANAYWKLLKRWQEVCKNMYCYEYDPVSWIGGLPCPIYLERAGALQKQHQMGIKGVINDMGPRSDASLFVNRYMEIRFKANPWLDPQKELDDMCSKFFGPAAGKYMFNYYIKLAEAVNNGLDLRFGIDGYEKIFTTELVTGCRQLLDKAIKAAGQDDAMVVKRLKMVELEQVYLEKYWQFISNLQKSDYQQSLADSKAIYQAIDALAQADKNYIEPVDAKHRINNAVKKNMAKIFFEQMGFIRNWTLVGPFKNSQHDAFITADALDCNGNGFFIKNKKVETLNYASDEGFIDFRKAFKNAITGDDVYYAYATTVVKSPNQHNVQFRTDSFNPFKIWVNGRVVYERAGLDEDCPDKRVFSVTLRPGENRIVVMVAQDILPEIVRWGFWLRITDAQGNPDNLTAADAKKEDRTETDAALSEVKAGKLTNLIPCPGFEELAKLEYSSFGVWPPAIKSNVTLDDKIACDGKTSVKFTGIKSGSLNRFFPVKSGEKYLVGLDCLNSGPGVCYIAASWRSKDKFMENTALNYAFFPEGDAPWKKAAGIVTVPPDADQMVYAICVDGQGPQESCNVDNLMLYKLK